MGVPRLYQYIAKCYPEILADTGAVSGDFNVAKLPQAATYLIDVNNFRSTRVGPKSNLLEKVIPVLQSAVLAQSTIILFYDQSDSGEDTCKAIQRSLRKACKAQKSACNVYICQNTHESADKKIFLTVQALKRRNSSKPIVIVSSDSDMLVHGLLNSDSCSIFILSAMPEQRSLFSRRATAQSSASGENFRWQLIQLQKLRDTLGPAHVAIFVLHCLLLLGTAAQQAAATDRKRSREDRRPRWSFAGLLTHHKDDITIYSALDASWKGVERRLAKQTTKKELVSSRKDQIVVSAALLADMLLDLGPSVTRGQDAPANAEAYLRNAALTLGYFQIGTREYLKLEAPLVVPSLSALCSVLEKTSSFTIPVKSGSQSNYLCFIDSKGEQSNFPTSLS